MRRRFVVATVLITLAAIAVLGVPLGFVGSRLVRNENLRLLDTRADEVALAVEARQDARQPVDTTVIRRFAQGDLWVAVTVDGRTVQAGRRPGRVTLSAPVTTAGGARVVVGEPASDLDGRARRAWAVIAGLAVVGVAAAVGLGIIQARRVSAPLEELAVVSGRLGAGDFAARASARGVPEVAAVADALNTSAERIGSLLAVEQRFALDASHQLRTPLTGLRIRLEEIAASDDLTEIRDEAAAALTQADRLTATITDLLEARRRGRAGPQAELDVNRAVSEQAHLWDDTFARHGRTLEVTVGPAVRVRSSAAALRQGLDVLLDNALRHGDGRVLVSVAAIGEGVSVRVSDEGPGVNGGSIDRAAEPGAANGVGLALARALLEAEGGRLQLVAARPATFEIVLPTNHEQR